jgi:poly[(R)-3-hydroxyalkanoate] polymerase subunit PhaC
VLSTSGHIAAIVNPPTNKRARFRTARELAPADPEEWLEAAPLNQGTWWTDWDAWLSGRSGGSKPAPSTLGNIRYRAVGGAPGDYVHEA